MTTQNAKPFDRKEYSLMKFIVGLSSFALIALSSSPSLAAHRAITNSTVRSLSLPSNTTKIQVAGSFDTIEREQRRAAQRAAAQQRKQDNLLRQQQNREAAEQRAQERETRQKKWRDEADAGRNERIQRQEAAKLKREAQIEAARKRQEELAAAQAAKAEERRKQWESLTPKQKEEYLAQERKSKAAAAFWLKVFGAAMSNGSSEPSTSSQPGQDDTLDRNRAQQERDRQAERDRQPAPAPVTPIGGSCGIYGNGPCY
jgi:hypothetical protein